MRAYTYIASLMPPAQNPNTKPNSQPYRTASEIIVRVTGNPARAIERRVIRKADAAQPAHIIERAPARSVAEHAIVFERVVVYVASRLRYDERRWSDSATASYLNESAPPYYAGRIMPAHVRGARARLVYESKTEAKT